jgi:allantoinase
VEPDRLDYSPIIERPRVAWPNNARLALWVAPNIEFYEYLPRGAIRSRNPYPRCPHPDILMYGYRDYGNRVGLWRMLDVLDHHKVTCTVSLNIAVYEHFPEIMAACEDRRWDIMSHGMYNTQFYYGMSEDEERAAIQDCVSTYRKLTGRSLTGWFSPAESGTTRTPDLIAEAGLKYIVEWHYDDQPLSMKVRTGSLVALPYSIDVNDGWNLKGNVEAEELIQAITDQFDRLYKEGESSTRVMCLALHPWVLGQPHRLKYLDKILSYIRSHEGVWFATAAEISDWYVAHQQPIPDGCLTTTQSSLQGAQ